MLVALTLLAVAFHVFMEWLFFATKPSFLTTLRPADRLLVAGTAAFPLLAAALALGGLLGLGAVLASGPAGPERERRLARRLAAGRLVPAACLALTALLLLDNFTHTLFRFGLETFAGPVRHLYALALAGLVVACYRLVRGWQAALARSRGARLGVLASAGAVLAFSAAALVVQREPVRPLAASDLAAAAPASHRLAPAPAARQVTAGPGMRQVMPAPAARQMMPAPSARQVTAGPAARQAAAAPAPAEVARASAAAPAMPAPRPNILVIGGDGVDAAHLSLYGYRRETTPFLDRLAGEALVCDRAFPNAANTGGAVVSLLSGRLPIDTGVLYPPDVLRGQAAYLHLPAILRRLGYRTAEVSVRWYADGVDLNMRDAFDEANSRLVGSPRADRLLAELGGSGGYFLARMGERARERLVHIATRRPWPDPYGEVTTHREMSRRDAERVGQLLAFADASPEPWFAHVHLLGTHGGRFFPQRRRFSAGRDQSEDWMADFYDDAILELDRNLERAFGALAARGLLERTVVVVYSDHDMGYATSRRTPLLFRFPGGRPAGRLAAAAQNLDVAPTLLDYLGIAQPRWMTGRSLLAPDLDSCRWLVSAASNDRFHVQQGLWWVSVPRPPFYTLGTLSVTAGDRHFALDLATGRFRSIPTDLPPEAAGRCPTPDPETVRAFLLDRLRAAGYDTASLASLER